MNEKFLDANERVAVGRSGCLSQMDCMSEHAAIVGVRLRQKTTLNSCDLRHQTNSSEAGDRRTHDDRDEATTLDQSVVRKDISNTGSRLSIQLTGAYGSACQPAVQLSVLCFDIRTGRCKLHLQLVRTASMAHSGQRIEDSNRHSRTIRHRQQYFHSDSSRQHRRRPHGLHARSDHRSPTNTTRRPGRPASGVHEPFQ